jgi:regulator of chromosome condensation
VGACHAALDLPPPDDEGGAGGGADRAAKRSKLASGAAGGLLTLASSAGSPAPGQVWRVFVTGSGECDQLGLGQDVVDLERPRLVRALAKVRVARIAVGGIHTLALTPEGQVWSWGCNDEHMLGRGGACYMPGRVRGLLDGPATVPGFAPVCLISAGDCHSVAVDTRGRVFAWGTYKGAEGTLGFDAHTLHQPEPKLLPVHEQFGRAVQLSSGAEHAGITTESGVGVVWGYGGQGQLGMMFTSQDLRDQPAGTAGLTPHQIHAKRSHAAAGPSPLAGRKTKRGSGAPEHRHLLSSHDYPVKAVYCTGYSTFVVAEDDSAEGGERVFACGMNTYGQLGLGDLQNRTEGAEEVLGLRFRGAEADGIAHMAGGSQHTLAMTKKGAVYAFGRADSGQLGLDEKSTGRIPVAACAFVPVCIPQKRFLGAAVASIAAGGCSSIAATSDGRVFSWGFGESGQLGNGQSADENKPFLVSGPIDEKTTAPTSGELRGCGAVQVGMGGQHAVILAEGGKAVERILEKERDATAVVEDPIHVETDADWVEIDENEDKNDLTKFEGKAEDLVKNNVGESDEE